MTSPSPYDYDYDVAILGAGAAGLYCASLAAARGHKVILIDHREKVAEKIRISGGGRCNFTNLYSGPENFLSQNKHFAKSALASYRPSDFIALVDRYNIPWHEKKLGQLFCDHSAQDIIDMLLQEGRTHQVTNLFGAHVSHLEKTSDGFLLHSSKGTVHSQKFVVATGGLSIPKIGATGFGYDIAKQFGLPVIAPRAALVPLTFTDHLKAFCTELSGLSVDAIVKVGKTAFSEGMLFTHRGLSGPSILQISSYWQEGMAVEVNLAPQAEMASFLLSEKQTGPKQIIQNVLAKQMPKRLAGLLCEGQNLSGRLADIADAKLRKFAEQVEKWQIIPSGTEGYRTAEVTLGGVDTSALSSKDMQAKSVQGLYFIGEVMDVTGHLGGHNFQWAWASAYATASHL